MNMGHDHGTVASLPSLNTLPSPLFGSVICVVGVVVVLVLVVVVCERVELWVRGCVAKGRGWALDETTRPLLAAWPPSPVIC